MIGSIFNSIFQNMLFIKIKKNNIHTYSINIIHNKNFEEKKNKI